MALCAEHQILARGFTDGKIGLYDYSTDKLMQDIEAHKSTVSSLCFTPDGTYLISSSHDRTVVVRRCSDGAIIKRFEDFQWCVTSTCVTPCGRYVVCGSIFRIKCFCLSTGRMVCSLKDCGCLWSLCVSPDNRLLGLARYDGSINIITNPIVTYWRRLWARCWLQPHDSNGAQLNRFFLVYPGLLQLVGTKILLYFSLPAP